MTKTLEQRVALIEDREAIAALQFRYINLNDGGWGQPTHRDPDAVADLFTEDGEWIGPLETMRAVGRIEIAELFQQFQAIPFIIHNVMNQLIEVDGDRARAEWHAIVASTFPGGQAFWTLGRYHNRYLRTADGWRYTSMSFETAAASPYEKGWGVEQFMGAEASVVD
ncbi:nuclear transport factor 2 family protein [[Mycobacterium] burgundiense]|uniref:Nuclear transport factor 2 family protein n=1 Tax=[Mycobacterium] burgundiense TaxID=3064286 RepID=A0ABN9NRH8_9MYCO|nr:nuclear transport factor 2 family protein [Mycolicibacterium sp. MU0053]CAJ1510744.1 nuclear transport factor 2 family protein [Mycolicibacterium sp. MU0053]